MILQKDTANDLKNAVWEKKEYYALAKDLTLREFLQNFGLRNLRQYSLESFRVLDCGCGDGVNIQMIYHPKARFWGIDISSVAIKEAKTRFKSKDNIHFKVGDINQLDFPDGNFDLVYTAYTLEHLASPEKVIREMIRVAKKDGYLVLIAPNYGSPLSFSPSSPPKGETFTLRAVKQFLKSHWYLIRKPSGLDWIKVEPVCLKRKRWQPDWDTVVEPYLQTLLYFLEKEGLKIIEFKTYLSSGKEKEVAPQTRKQKLLRIFKKIALVLEKWQISPYRYFGPDFMVVAQKQ